ncbi:unnamed protein product [Calypogeia fissa]
MAIVVAVCALNLLNVSSNPFHGSQHEARANLLSNRNGRAKWIIQRSGRICRREHIGKINGVSLCPSWLGKRSNGIVSCCSGGGRSEERGLELAVRKFSTSSEGEDEYERNSEQIWWKKIKEVTTAVVLSAIISLPGSFDYNSVLAEELTLDSPSSSSSSSELRVKLENPECSGKGIIRVVDEPSISSAEPVTNESVVEEAWQVVNENFLDARHHSWSADDWATLREDVLKRPIRSRMAAYGAIKGMLATLNDPYTRFLTPDQFRELSKYDVTGVGLNIGEVENGKGEVRLAVLGIVLGSPAQMMGVRQGDELLAVNGSSVEGLSAFEAASLIQGPKGTPVSIEIRHGPCEDVKTITVPRQQDVRTPVYYRLERTQNPGELMGYIRLREFNALAKKDLVIAMKRLQEAGATSFMLDLQDNPGGLVQAGVEVARLFLDGGETVIQTVGRDPANYKSIIATNAPLTTAPLMVLVNDHTASASEIVAAALHDNCRAILVGNRTFGKGLIQSVYELSDGSGLILTVGKYVTPGKIDIDGNGIEPDFKNPPGLPEAKQKLGSCELRLKEN